MPASGASKPELEQLPRPWYLIPSRRHDNDSGFLRVRRLKHEWVLDWGAVRGPPVGAILLVLSTMAIVGLLVLDRALRGTSAAARSGVFFVMAMPFILLLVVGTLVLLIRRVRAARRAEQVADAAPVLRLDPTAGILALPRAQWQIDVRRVIGLDGVRQWPPEFHDEQLDRPHKAQLLLVYVDPDDRVRRRIVMPDVTEGFWLERRGPLAAETLGLPFRLTSLSGPAAMLPMPQDVSALAADPLVTPENHWPPPTHCAKCSYPRQGLDDASCCPECGHVVTAAHSGPLVRWG